MEIGPDAKTHVRSAPYHPQPGDIVLFDDHSLWQHRLYRCCGTAKPLHAGIVFCRPDHTFALLEAGPNASMKVYVFDLGERLHKFYGTILIRQPRTPLAPQQSQQLTSFSLAQEGKGYAVARVLLQATPFRPKGTSLRGDLFGCTVLDRNRWICSELVVAAAVAAGVLDGDHFPANAMYPRDLCYDERHNLRPWYEEAAMWYPRPQPEFVGDGVRVISAK
jgi:hypothetical protein